MVEVASTVTTINTGLSAAKTAFDLVQSIAKLFGRRADQDSAVLKERLLEMKEALLMAKETVLALRDENHDLKQRVFDLDRLNRLRESATLCQIADGAFVYILSDDPETIKKGPWYCQPCLDGGKQAVFQRKDRKLGYDISKCPVCSSEIQTPNDIKADIAVGALNLDRFWGFGGL